MKRLMKYLCLLLLGFLISNRADCQGIITTIAGNGMTQYIGDGSPATNFSLGGPAGICLDKVGNLYIANLYTARISKLLHDTLITIVDTAGISGYSGDGGLADTAALSNPIGVCLDTGGNLYITDVYYDVVRKVNVEGFISTICGSGSGGFGGDGGPATMAQIETPHGTCIDRSGNLYVADFGNHRVRKMDLNSGIITTFAGTGTNSYSGDNGPAAQAELSFPSGVCTDLQGNIYIADYDNNRIRKVDGNSGIITTVAGNGNQNYNGDGGLATNASLNQPNSVFVANDGSIYISDFGNNVIRVVTGAGFIYTIAGSGLLGTYGNYGDGGKADTAKFEGPTAISVDNSGNIFIADGGNSTIRKVTPAKFPTAGIPLINQSAFDVYPNPTTTGKFTVRMGGAPISAGIKVFNALGQCLFNEMLNSSQLQVDLCGNPTGLYFVQMIAADNIVTRKVIIE
jgi:sugar lactone lactonase YvrE